MYTNKYFIRCNDTIYKIFVRGFLLFFILFLFDFSEIKTEDEVKDLFIIPNDFEKISRKKAQDLANNSSKRIAFANVPI